MPILCDFRKLLATASTATGFAAIIPKAAEPVVTANGGVIDLGKGCTYKLVKFVFFGEGADDTTFDVRIYGWHQVLSATGSEIMWVPVILADLSCTLSTIVGIANGAVVAADRFADTITVNDGQPATFFGNPTVDVISPAENIATAYAIVNPQGCRYLTVDYDMTGATNGNALYGAAA